MTTLFDPPIEDASHRVRALANVLAGFVWPDRGSFERLTKAQQEAALSASREAIAAARLNGGN